MIKTTNSKIYGKTKISRFEFFRAVIILIIVSYSILTFVPYVRSERLLTVGIDRYSPPFCFPGSEPDSVRGFNVDLTKMLLATMGAKPRFVAAERNELKRLLLDGKIDFMIAEKEYAGPLIHAVQLPIQIERKLFVNKECMTVVCTKDFPGHTVVTVKGHDVVRLIPDTTKVKLIEVDNQEAALELIEHGKADVYLSANGLSTIYLIRKNNLKNVKEVGVPVEKVALALLIPQWNTTLLTDLSVAF